MKTLLLCSVVLGSMLSFKLVAALDDVDAADVSINVSLRCDEEDAALLRTCSRQALNDLDAQVVEGDGEAQISIVCVRLKDAANRHTGYAVSTVGGRMLSIDEMAKSMRFETKGVPLAELTAKRLFGAPPSFHTLHVVSNKPGALEEQITKTIDEFNGKVLEVVRQVKDDNKARGK